MMLDWSILPKRLSYLQKPCSKLESAKLYLVSEIRSFVDQLANQDISELAEVYQRIEKKEDGKVISEWLDECARVSVQNSCDRAVSRLFAVFDILAEKKIEPFCNRNLQYRPLVRALNWEVLPKRLHYLIPYALKYGTAITDSQVDAKIRSLAPDDFQKLSGVADHVRAHRDYKIVNRWLDQYSISEYKEAELVYFLFGVMDHLGLQFD